MSLFSTLAKIGTGFMKATPWTAALGMGIDYLTQEGNKNAADREMDPYKKFGAYGIGAAKTAGDYWKSQLAGYVDPAVLAEHQAIESNIGQATTQTSQQALRDYNRVGNPGKGLVASNTARLTGAGAMKDENVRFANSIIERKVQAAGQLGATGANASSLGYSAGSQKLGAYTNANNTISDSVGGVLGSMYEDKINERMMAILKERGVPVTGVSLPTTQWNSSSGYGPVPAGYIRLPDGRVVPIRAGGLGARLDWTQGGQG